MGVIRDGCDTGWVWYTGCCGRRRSGVDGGVNGAPRGARLGVDGRDRVWTGEDGRQGGTMKGSETGRGRGLDGGGGLN